MIERGRAACCDGRMHPPPPPERDAGLTSNMAVLDSENTGSVYRACGRPLLPVAIVRQKGPRPCRAAVESNPHSPDLGPSPRATGCRRESHWTKAPSAAAGLCTADRPAPAHSTSPCRKTLRFWPRNRVLARFGSNPAVTIPPTWPFASSDLPFQSASPGFRARTRFRGQKCATMPHAARA